jgi:hypothetical protein
MECRNGHKLRIVHGSKQRRGDDEVWHKFDHAFDEGNFSRARFKIRFQEFVSRSKRMIEPDSTELNNMRYITISKSL